MGGKPQRNLKKGGYFFYIYLFNEMENKIINKNKIGIIQSPINMFFREYEVWESF